MNKLKVTIRKHYFEILFFLALIGTILAFVLVFSGLKALSDRHDTGEIHIQNELDKIHQDLDSIHTEIDEQHSTTASNIEITPETLPTQGDIPAEDTITNPSWEIGDRCDLPTLDTSVKAFTDYRVYDIWYTPHYRLQQVATTDANGLRRYGDDYLVALGSYYSTSIGDRFLIVTNTGNVFTVMLADGTQDQDTVDRMYAPCINYDGEPAANVLEFIIDSDVLSSEIYAYGDLNKIPSLQGEIIMMEYLGRDDSADWDTYETR